MLRYPDVFTSLGRGMYGLRDWGISRPPFLKDFLTDTMWIPLFAEPRYGVLPLVAGTLVTTLVALAVAIPA